MAGFAEFDVHNPIPAFELHEQLYNWEHNEGRTVREMVNAMMLLCSCVMELEQEIAALKEQRKEDAE